MADFDSDTPASSTGVLNCPMSCRLFFFLFRFSLQSKETQSDGGKKNTSFFADSGFLLNPLLNKFIHTMMNELSVFNHLLDIVINLICFVGCAV